MTLVIPYQRMTKAFEKPYATLKAKPLWDPIVPWSSGQRYCPLEAVTTVRIRSELLALWTSGQRQEALNLRTSVRIRAGLYGVTDNLEVHLPHEQEHIGSNPIAVSPHGVVRYHL